MKLSELCAGDLVLADDGFTCLNSGAYTVQADAEGRLFIPCSEGGHYLDGQVSFIDPGELIGITKAIPIPHERGFTKLSNEPPAKMRHGPLIPLDDRTTAEMMADRDGY